MATAPTATLDIPTQLDFIMCKLACCPRFFQRRGTAIKFVAAVNAHGVSILSDLAGDEKMMKATTYASVYSGFYFPDAMAFFRRFVAASIVICIPMTDEFDSVRQTGVSLQILTTG